MFGMPRSCVEPNCLSQKKKQLLNLNLLSNQFKNLDQDKRCMQVGGKSIRFVRTAYTKVVTEFFFFNYNINVNLNDEKIFTRMHFSISCVSNFKPVQAFFGIL